MCPRPLFAESSLAEVTTRSIAERIAKDDAIVELRELVAESEFEVEVLPSSNGRDELLSLQISTHSDIGAIVYHTGGIIFEGGWLRVWGSGHPRVPHQIVATNEQINSPGILIAHDAIGGVFCWNHQPRTIHYFAPDTMEWEDLEIGYSAWLRAFLNGSYQGFYQDAQFEGWRERIHELSPEQVWSAYPPLFISSDQRDYRPIPCRESWNLSFGA